MGRIPHDNDILYEFDGKYIKKYSGSISTYIIN